VRIRHRDAAAGPCEHRHIVRIVAECDDVARLDAEIVGDLGEARRLVHADGGDLDGLVSGQDDGGALAGDLSGDREDRVDLVARVQHQQLRSRTVE
jgi:hypothetical protein